MKMFVEISIVEKDELPVRIAGRCVLAGEVNDLHLLEEINRLALAAEDKPTLLVIVIGCTGRCVPISVALVAALPYVRDDKILEACYTILLDMFRSREQKFPTAMAEFCQRGSIPIAQEGVE